MVRLKGTLLDWRVNRQIKTLPLWQSGPFAELRSSAMSYPCPGFISVAVRKYLTSSNWGQAGFIQIIISCYGPAFQEHQGRNSSSRPDHIHSQEQTEEKGILLGCQAVHTQLAFFILREFKPQPMNWCCLDSAWIISPRLSNGPKTLE